MKPRANPQGLSKRLRQWEGPLTEELVLHPGDFGLGKVPARLKPDSTTSMVCGFCSTGCALNIHLRGGVAVNLTADTHYPVNLGMACPKGWEALTPLSAPDRATSPLLRNARGNLEPVTWEVALEAFCGRFRSIQAAHGPDSVAWLGTGQMPSEELAFLGALAKFGMGLIHGDGNTRQCMATAVAAYKESFGFDAPPFAYADLEESDALIFIGANPCIAHPIMWQRVLRNRRRPEIVVVDPRKTETAMAATQHYAIRPKSDLVLLYGLARMLLANGWINRDFITNHTNGFDEFAAHVSAFSPEHVCAGTGLTREQLTKLARTIGCNKRVSFWWTMGVNQGHEATRTAQAIINLALMSGNIGRPGTGANSITGQCNAMGSRLFSNTTNLLGGHDFLEAAHREKVARILGISAARIPQRNSMAYDQIVQGIAGGAVRGLWIVATNPAHSWPDRNAFHKLAQNLDFLVVQDMYANTETARHAHLVLPAAGWGEKEGTFINSERRIGLVKKVARAPGQALADFHIFRLIAHAWGCAEMFARWQSPEAVFEILKEVTRGQPCDITGIAGYEEIDAAGGIQWPFPRGGEPANPERRLFEDRKFYTPDGRARFVFADPRGMPEPPCAEFPLLLLTGRGTSSQWHTQTRTAKSGVLRKLYPHRIYAEINAEDASALQIKPGEKVRITSRRGELEATAFVATTVQRGQVFVPMHYVEANRLTLAVFDPHSRQPAYKAAAVRVEPVRKAARRG